MASIGDLYQDQYTNSRDRLLSARTGSANIIQNQQQNAGYAAPALAFLAGREASKMNSEQEEKAKHTEFLQNFAKLTTAAPGAAIKYWNDHAGEVGIKSTITGGDMDDVGMKWDFSTGDALGVGRSGQVYTIDENGQKIPVTKEVLDRIRTNAKLKIEAKSNKKYQDVKTEIEIAKLIKDIDGKIADFEAKGGNYIQKNSVAYQNLKEDRMAMETRYKEITGKDWRRQPANTPPPPPQAPAPGSLAGGAPQLGSGVPVFGGQKPTLGGMAPAPAPGPAPAPAGPPIAGSAPSTQADSWKLYYRQR